VFGSGPGTTPTPNETATALQPSRVARLIVSRANSYLRATPRLVRLFSADHPPSPGLPTPARASRSQVSSRLHRVSHVASGRYPAGTSPDGHAPARPTFAPVETTGDFGGQKRQASSYPSAKAVRGSAPSLTRLTGKRLPAFLWLSYSRPPDLPEVPDPGQRIGHACRQVVNSPRRPRLNEPCGTLTRIAAERLWPEPPGRDLHPLGRKRPHDSRHEVCPCRPSPGRSIASDRTSVLLCEGNGPGRQLQRLFPETGLGR
jgi:hypothetical protein